MHLEDVTVQVLLTVVILVQLFVILSLVGQISGVDMLKAFKKDGKVTEQQPVETPINPSDEFEPLTEDERGTVFDQRIMAMKAELAEQHNIVPRPGHTAEELHPGVTNLPHSIISDTHSDSTGEEYAK